MALETLPILVVIGGGGIGLATARRLGAGRHVLFASRSASTISAGAESLKKAGLRVTTRQVDISSYESVVGLAKTAASLGSVIEAVVLTSAISPSMGSTETMLAVNILGTANVIEAFGKEIDMPTGSSLVCVGSMAHYIAPPLSPDLEKHLASAPLASLIENEEIHSVLGGAGGVAYSLTKKAKFLRVQAAAVSKEYADRGVRVNCVSPGMTETNMLMVELEGESGEGIRAMLRKHPLRRAGTAEEVADAIAFVVGCKYVNGTDFLVDGGSVAKIRWGGIGT